MLMVAPILEQHRTPLSAQQLETMTHDRDLRQRVNIVRSAVPAVTHVDYSARVQTVDPDRNPDLYRVMSAFFALTGCPVLVNTSFNVRGEPIVCTPEDAYRCFMGTEMDALVLENFVLVKDRTTDGSEDPKAREKYLAQFQLD